MLIQGPTAHKQAPNKDTSDSAANCTVFNPNSLQPGPVVMPKKGFKEAKVKSWSQGDEPELEKQKKCSAEAHNCTDEQTMKVQSAPRSSDPENNMVSENGTQDGVCLQ